MKDTGESTYEIVFEKLVGKFVPKHPQATINLTKQPVSEGNAFVILGKLKRSLTNAKINQIEINQILEEARSGTYEYLLRTVAKTVTVI